MTMRSCFYPLLGDKIFGTIGDAVDILSIAATMFGVCTSLGVGAIQFNGGLKRLNPNIESSIQNQILIIWGITLLATISVVTGIKIGIRRLSEICFAIGMFIMLFVLFYGDTWYMLNVYVQSEYGHRVQDTSVQCIVPYTDFPSSRHGLAGRWKSLESVWHSLVTRTHALFDSALIISKPHQSGNSLCSTGPTEMQASSKSRTGQCVACSYQLGLSCNTLSQGILTSTGSIKAYEWLQLNHPTALSVRALPMLSDTSSLSRMINFKFPLQPQTSQCEELGFFVPHAYEIWLYYQLSLTVKYNVESR